MYWYCPVTERDAVLNHPEWGTTWPFNSYKPEEVMAGMKIYELCYKYHFLRNITSSNVLQAIVQHNDLEPGNVPLEFAVDWYPRGDPDFSLNFIGKVRAMAFQSTVEATKMGRPAHADNPEIRRAIEDMIPSLEGSNDWFEFVYHQWCYKYDDFVHQIVS